MVGTSDYSRTSVYSGWKWLEKGIPQGLIHGPDYFTIFLNDLCYCLDRLCNIYNDADNSTLPGEGKDNLDVASCQVVTWFHQNYMQATADKLPVSMLSRDPQTHIYYL